MKYRHEIRDPIHSFVYLDDEERRVLDSRPLQRLRNIHQLALSYLVYPGASHKRFEHSLGVMELATRVYDVITRSAHEVQGALGPGRRLQLPEELDQPDKLTYWKRVLRMAALCHDVGHLPFSHAAERALPTGWKHEHLTKSVVLSLDMKHIWETLTPPLQPTHIAKVAVGPNIYTEEPFSTWELLLSEIISGDAFGVDRIDYLLRDSHHLGVAYGRFDHLRLIDTLCILPRPVSEDSSVAPEEPTLGIEHGGLESASALLLARYFMFQQVYYHPVRRIYDIHLNEFLLKWLPGGSFSIDADKHLDMTDVDVLSGIKEAAGDEANPAHEPAKRIADRRHFKVAYSLSRADLRAHPEPGRAIHQALAERFGEENVRWDPNPGASREFHDFPVYSQNDEVVSAWSESRTLSSIPFPSSDYVFVSPSLREEARKWLEQQRHRILANARVEGEEE